VYKLFGDAVLEGLAGIGGRFYHFMRESVECSSLFVEIRVKWMNFGSV